ncbi:MAG TPA: peptidase S24 [Clostridium sp.]|nr:peptidase S24 [Clostridium sp.]
MRLYCSTAKQFINDNDENNIMDKMKLSFFYKYRCEPSHNEMLSWQKSLGKLSRIFKNIGLDTNGVILEYKLPLTSKRLNCIVTGKDSKNNDKAVVIQLKEWQECKNTDGKNELIMSVHDQVKEVLHPSVQTMQYVKYLKGVHSAFANKNNDLELDGCSFLHNYEYEENDPVLNKKFEDACIVYPVFSSTETKKLESYIKDKVGNGEGIEILNELDTAEYNSDKKLMNHVSNIIKGIPEYILLDEQQIVYDKVFNTIENAYKDEGKKVIIIKGGPGTGKSVIAINLMADLLKAGYETNYATGSRAFTETLRSIIGSKGSQEFKYFNSYMKKSEQELDVLICDEAHRIRKSSNNRFTKKEDKSDLEQIDELFNAAKVSVFFIDDNQRVRPDEIGSTSHIRNKAEERGYEVFEYSLKVQFRCSGSENFVNWIDNTLEIKKTSNVIYDNSQDEFDFKIVNSPFELERMIKEKAEEGYSARMVAGFCWPWSKAPDEDGNLVNDIVIGDFKRPWNAHPDIRNLKSDIPKAPKWAQDPNGINQIGCIYTAQGFEFDYIGVIIGKDLTYDLDKSEWIGNKEYCKDTMVKREKENFTQLIKNTYRVLLSRGMKGCYVWFEDEGAQWMVRSRVE